MGRDLPSAASAALAGVVLAGGPLSAGALLPLGAAVALACAAGALLQAGDPRLRVAPSLPLTRGALALGLLGGALAALAISARVAATPAPIGAGLMLCASVLAAELWLRGRRARPLALGVARALLYLTAAATVGARPPGAVWAAAAAMGAYACGAALAAEKKRSPSRRAGGVALAVVPLAYGPLLVHDRAGAIYYGLLLAWVLFTAVDAVVCRRAALARWLAGAALFDALAITAEGAPGAALAAACGFALTCAQRRR